MDRVLYFRYVGCGRSFFEVLEPKIGLKTEENSMLGEKTDVVNRVLKMQPVQVQLEVGEFLDEMIALFPQDRIDGPRKTRLFALAVASATTGRENQYVAITAADHCSGNYGVKSGKFRIQVQTKGGEPGPDWHHCLRWDKGGGIECWENEPRDQLISKGISECVSKARKSLAR